MPAPGSDLTGDSISPEARSSASIQLELKKIKLSQARALLRWRTCAFYVIGGLAALYLLALLWLLVSFFLCGKVPILGPGPYLIWPTIPVAIIIGTALVIFAAVPLSLIAAISRALAGRQQQPAGQADEIALPQRIVLEGLKDAAGLGGN